MAHVQTKDPLGLCGALVVCISKSSTSSSSTCAVAGGGFDLFGDAARTPAHAWVTRYDARLDCYSLFAPTRGVSVHSRGDMMKLVSDPNFDVQRVDDDPGGARSDVPPPPLEDATSRYVGVPFVRAAATGAVACFLPFADAYRVEFDDGARAEVSEDEVIDSMVCQLTAAGSGSSGSSSKEEREGARKRKRTQQLPLSAGAAAAPAPLLPPTTVRSVSTPVSVAVPPPSMMPVSFSGLPGVDSSPVVTRSNILELAAARNRSSSAAASAAPPPRPPAAPLVKQEPLSHRRRSDTTATNIIMLIDDEPDVAMIPLDADEAVHVPVVSATTGNDPWADAAAAAAAAQPQPMYLVTKAEHEQVAPLESRTHAYKYHISSIKRFTEVSGLVVLNHLLATFLLEDEDGTRDADVLLLLKIVAMLPIPARKHVADSKIALTIGKLAKPRSLELFPQLPVCATHLAKWIKRNLPLSAGGVTAGRRSSLKPDWLRQQETLRRTRFTSEGGQDSAAEYNHYKRVRLNGPSASGAPSAVSGASSTAAAVGAAGQGATGTGAVLSAAPDNEQLEAAGGACGTYGRKQTLTFGSRWSVVEFLRDAPPNSIRPAAASTGSARSSSYHHPSQSQWQHGRLRSILRRESKYQGNLDSFR
ncbi:hypothetical protein PybrP1_008586 [[Pythium] brassicae (nom. inval.)]|nr:hypothetical protein PybrP1_008586 [[Pythium] brassicae (nom. inval.)]